MSFDGGALLSGSGIGRAAECPPAYALPAVRTSASDPSKAAARRGTAGHAFIRAVQAGVPVARALAEVPPEWRGVCQRLDVDALPRGESEVAVAYDVATGRARRTGEADRAYSPSATEIPGTLDLLSTRADGCRRVSDWKFSLSGDIDVGFYAPQADFYSLCVARIEGLDRIESAIDVVHDDGHVETFAWELDAFALADVATTVRKAWHAVQAARKARREHEARSAAPWLPDVVEGGHCKWCAAAAACPAKRASIAALLGQDVGAIVEPAQLARAYVRAKSAEDAIERVRKAIKDHAVQYGSVATGDGAVVKLDGRGALRIARG